MFQLKIPFKLSFSHAKAERFFSDSLILKLEAENSSGKRIAGYGEAVVREYVSGETASVETAMTEILSPFRDCCLSKNKIFSLLEDAAPPVEELPLYCAVESALLQLLCEDEQSDIYSLIERPALRSTITYGGTLPLLPEAAAERLLQGYKKMGISNLRVKIGTDPGQIRSSLTQTRRILGDSFDLKVDANAGWSLADAENLIPLLREFGVSIIEEPFGRTGSATESGTEHGTPVSLSRLSEAFDCSGIIFMADESALTAEDIEAAAEQQTFQMVNIRLAKNGGLLKALKMAETAEKNGIRYMCGCHVGETGILSAMGRTAASLMKNPEYTDGSYDAHLLSGNITTEDLSFGFGGKAPIITGNGCGYTVDENKLKGYCSETITCF